MAACVVLGVTLLLGTYVKAANAVVSNSTTNGQKKVVMTDNGSNSGVLFTGRIPTGTKFFCIVFFGIGNI